MAQSPSSTYHLYRGLSVREDEVDEIKRDHAENGIGDNKFNFIQSYMRVFRHENLQGFIEQTFASKRFTYAVTRDPSLEARGVSAADKLGALHYALVHRKEPKKSVPLLIEI